MTEPMSNGYSSDSTQRELSNEYQHGRVKMVFVSFVLDESRRVKCLLFLCHCGGRDGRLAGFSFTLYVQACDTDCWQETRFLHFL